MKRLLCLFAACFCLLLPLSAQLIKELEDRRTALQRQIAESETLLQATRKDMGSQLDGLATLVGRIEERKRYILVLNHDLETLGREVETLGRQLERLQEGLQERKDKYAASVRYLQKNRSVQEKLLFIFSARTLEQTYRRLRYVREYAAYQRLQGEEIRKKQEQVRAKQAELSQARQAKERLLQEREAEKARLEAQEKEKKDLVAGLRRQQRSLQVELARKRREAGQLNARIDRLVAEEVEKARKRAEEEARQEAARRKTASDAGKSPSGNSAKEKGEPLPAYALDKADRALSGSFANNRGRLPVPITGPYLITSRYGQYSVEGLRGVKLDNKGIDIQGKPGAKARAVFNGKVTAVFRLNGLFNILVRHGAYISVYCNLSSAVVKADDDVSTGQVLGDVFSDSADGGRTVLHFQLRKEKEKLNPEPWLRR